MAENAEASKKGGGIAKGARLELEAKTKKSVVTEENFLPPKKAVKNIDLENGTEDGNEGHGDGSGDRRDLSAHLVFLTFGGHCNS